MSKKFFIKERHNPQFKKPYYVPEGLLTKAEARRKEDKCIYGYNIMLEYNTEKEYQDAINKFREEGFAVH